MELKEFLISQGAWYIFLKNSHNRFFLSPRLHNISIGNAFGWDETPEGGNFWAKLQVGCYTGMSREYFESELDLWRNLKKPSIFKRI